MKIATWNVERLKQYRAVTLRFVSDGIESSSAPDADMMIDWFFQFVMNSPPSAAALLAAKQSLVSFWLL